MFSIKNVDDKKNKLIKSGRASGFIYKAFFAVFALLFGILIFGSVFFNMHFDYNAAFVVICTVGWLLLIFSVWKLSGKLAQTKSRKEYIFIACFAILVVLTQLFFYSQVAAYPTRDFERVFTGAVNYAVNGYIQDPYLDYFYKYPNNMPLTIILQFIFRFFYRFGFTNFHTIGAFLSAGSMLFAYVFIYLGCRRQFGKQGAYFSVMLLYLCIPLQCYVSIFYTDIFAFACMPFVYYCYLRLKEAKSRRAQIVFAALLAAAVAFGTKLKYSVIIIFVAVVFGLLLAGKWKKALGTLLIFAVFFGIVNMAFDTYMYQHFLNKEQAYHSATPMLSWIMMGLTGDGTHNSNDNHMIWYWPTRAEKTAQAWATIQERLGGHTLWSFIAFLNQKGIRSFGSGNLDYTHVVADSPMQQSFLVECVSENGKYFAVFDTITQGYHIALFVLIIAGAVLSLQRKKYDGFTIYLTIMGLYMFLLLWESGTRYLLQYYGIFILAGVFSVKMLCESKREKSKTA